MRRCVKLKTKIIIGVSLGLVLIFSTGIYFVRREWNRYRENNPLYIVPTAYDFPHKDYHHNKRIHFDGFSLLVPDDFSKIDMKSLHNTFSFKSSYSVIILHEDRFNYKKGILERLNIHCDSEYAAELYILSKTPDDCISINPAAVKRNCSVKDLKSIVLYSDIKKIYYHDFGHYSVIDEQMLIGRQCTIYRGGERYASITYVSRLKLLDQNTINQILSTIEFDK